MSRTGRDSANAVKVWNERHPVGTAVKVLRDDGSVMPTKTRSKATLLGGHSAVIWLEGISGCYSLGRVEAVGH